MTVPAHCTAARRSASAASDASAAKVGRQFGAFVRGSVPVTGDLITDYGTSCFLGRKRVFQGAPAASSRACCRVLLRGLRRGSKGGPGSGSEARLTPKIVKN